MTKQMVQHTEGVEPHGILHTIIEVVPGGEWTVIGVFLFGLISLGWLKFRKQIREMLQPSRHP